MRTLNLAIVAGFAIAPAALAQNTGAILTDGSATFRIGGTTMAINTSPTTTTGPTMDLYTQGLSTDHLFGEWWWYRTTGDTREFAIANAISRVTTGTNEVEYVYMLGVLEGTLNIKLTSPAFNEARVDQKWTIRNPTGGAVDLALFEYIDFDLNFTTSNSATLTMPNERQRIEHTASGTFADWWAHDADAYQVQSFATLRGLLTNTVIDNFGNFGLPFGPADWTGGFQWNRSIPAGGSIMISSSWGVNTPAEPPSSSCYPDCDTSTGLGVLDIFDFLCFGNRFSAGDPYACDCDLSTGPNVCDIFDFLCFGNAFNAGCP